MMKIVLIIIVLGMIIVGAIMTARDKKKGIEPEDDDTIISSEYLHEKVNEERKREGKTTVQAINTIGGTSTNNLARKDKSWNSVPDFFIKMGKGAGAESAADDTNLETEKDAPVVAPEESKDEE